MINIKTIRKQYNLTQGEFAEAIGMSRSVVSHWERGHQSPSDRKIKMIEDIFVSRKFKKRKRKC